MSVIALAVENEPGYVLKVKMTDLVMSVQG